jgi:hypothetical protein
MRKPIDLRAKLKEEDPEAAAAMEVSDEDMSLIS